MVRGVSVRVGGAGQCVLVILKTYFSMTEVCNAGTRKAIASTGQRYEGGVDDREGRSVMRCLVRERKGDRLFAIGREGDQGHRVRV